MVIREIAVAGAALSLAACSKPAASPDGVSFDGYKSVRIGAIETDSAILSQRRNADCWFARPSGMPAGVSVMFAQDTIARIDVDSAGVASGLGVAVGDSESKVTSAYDNVVTQPHKYLEGGHYLIVTSPTDSLRRGVFETESGKVVRFRFGKRPEVDFVEGCG